MKTLYTLASVVAFLCAAPAFATGLNTDPNVSVSVGVIGGGATSVSKSGGMTMATGTTVGLDGRGFSSAGALQGATNTSSVNGTLSFTDTPGAGVETDLSITTLSQSEQFSSIEMIDRGSSTHAEGGGIAKSGGIAKGAGGFLGAGFGTDFSW